MLASFGALIRSRPTIQLIDCSEWLVVGWYCVIPHVTKGAGVYLRLPSLIQWTVLCACNQSHQIVIKLVSTINRGVTVEICFPRASRGVKTVTTTVDVFQSCNANANAFPHWRSGQIHRFVIPWTWPSSCERCGSTIKSYGHWALWTTFFIYVCDGLGGHTC